MRDFRKQEAGSGSPTPPPPSLQILITVHTFFSDMYKNVKLESYHEQLRQRRPGRYVVYHYFCLALIVYYYCS